MKRLYVLGSLGDSIVEVLIAIAVVSSVLGGAYVSANRSLSGSRQSQERGEALKLIEGQMELLKALSGDPVKIYNSTPPFHINSTPDVVAGPYVNNSLGVEYTLQINRPASNTFEVKANWERAGGGGIEDTKLIYRVYP